MDSSESFRSRVEKRLKERIEALSKTNNALIRYTARMQEDMRHMKSQLLLVNNERQHLQMVLAIKKQEVVDLTGRVQDMSLHSSMESPSIAPIYTPLHGAEETSVASTGGHIDASLEPQYKEQVLPLKENCPPEDVIEKGGNQLGAEVTASKSWQNMRGKAFAAIDSFLKLHECELLPSRETTISNRDSSLESPPLLQVSYGNDVMADTIVRNTLKLSTEHVVEGSQFTQMQANTVATSGRYKARVLADNNYGTQANSTVTTTKAGLPSKLVNDSTRRVLRRRSVDAGSLKEPSLKVKLRRE